MTRSRNSRKGSFDFPRIRKPGFGVRYVRAVTKGSRMRAREALARGAEPEPYRPRHGARYDYW
jgi:hypothetical protein